MKLKKILTAIAATAVMTSLFAIGASAADNTITNVSYDAASGKVSFTLPDYKADQKTLLIVKTNSDGSYQLANLKDADIMQIDQNGTGWTEAQLAKDLAAGTKFVVLSGGNGTLYSSATYEVNGNSDIKYGELDGTDPVNIFDANILINYCAGLTTLTDNQMEAAELDGTDPVNIFDANQLVNYCAGLITSFPVENK